MLSGVGPHKELDQRGIKLIKDLPVGKNLQDHIIMGYTFTRKEPGLSWSTFMNANPLSYLNFIAYGTGPLSHCGISGMAFVHTSLNRKGDVRPDLQFHVTPIDYGTDYGVGFYKLFNINQTVWDAVYGHRLELYGFSIIPTLLRPKSRGQISLKNSDPRAEPVIDLNYFSDIRDVKVLAEGLKMVSRFADTNVFQKYEISPVLPDPFCKDFQPDSDGYNECYVRRNSGRVARRQSNLFIV
jgi:choline dehydrogenase-like flavoprotein